MAGWLASGSSKLDQTAGRDKEEDTVCFESREGPRGGGLHRQRLRGVMQPTQLLELMLHPSAESQPEPRTGANLLME